MSTIESDIILKPTFCKVEGDSGGKMKNAFYNEENGQPKLIIPFVDECKRWCGKEK